MNLISYFRVSTKAQGESGLGLDAQRAAVSRYAESMGGVVLGEYVEVESGRVGDRPELGKAIEHCRTTGAVLVVAKLDRLSRSVAFLANLMEAKVGFVCCDNPYATPLTLHILAAVAQVEGEFISRRTKEGLEQAKIRGRRLGGANVRCRNLTKASAREGRIKGTAMLKRKADEYYRLFVPWIKELHLQGLNPGQIAYALNKQGRKNLQGRDWKYLQVLRILKKYGGVS